MEKVKKFFGSVWSWVKENWLTILIIVGVCLLAVNAFSQFDKTKSYRELLEQYHQESLDHQRQIKDLRTIMEEERAEQHRIIQKYLEEQSRIESEFKQALERIARDRTVNQDNIIRDHEKDPTTLTTAVTETFGIPLE